MQPVVSSKQSTPLNTQLALPMKRARRCRAASPKPARCGRKRRAVNGARCRAHGSRPARNCRGSRRARRRAAGGLGCWRWPELRRAIRHSDASPSSWASERAFWARTQSSARSPSTSSSHSKGSSASGETTGASCVMSDVIGPFVLHEPRTENRMSAATAANGDLVAHSAVSLGRHGSRSGRPRQVVRRLKPHG